MYLLKYFKCKKPNYNFGYSLFFNNFFESSDT